MKKLTVVVPYLVSTYSSARKDYEILSILNPPGSAGFGSRPADR